MKSLAWRIPMKKLKTKFKVGETVLIKKNSIVSYCNKNDSGAFKSKKYITVLINEIEKFNNMTYIWWRSHRGNRCAHISYVEKIK